MPYQPLRVRPEQPPSANPFRVRSKSPDIEILPSAAVNQKEGKENQGYQGQR